MLRVINTGSTQECGRLISFILHQKRVQQLLEVKDIAVNASKHNVLVGSRLE